MENNNSDLRQFNCHLHVRTTLIIVFIVPLVFGATSWTPWSACNNVQCGKGTRFRVKYTTSCLTDRDGIKQCETTNVQNKTQPCFMDGVDLLNCTKASTETPREISGIVWNTWSAFGACSTSCGQGEKQRWRDGIVIKAYHNGSTINTSTTRESQIENCTVKLCEPCSVCVVWYPYSNCSSTCGRGTQSRGCRDMTVSYDPLSCSQSQQIFSKNCTNPPCQEPEDLEDDKSSNLSIMGVMGVLIASLLTFAIIIIVMLFLKKRQTDLRRRSPQRNNRRERFMQGFAGYNWIQNFRRRTSVDPIDRRRDQRIQNGFGRPNPRALPVSPPSYNTSQSCAMGLPMPYGHSFPDSPPIFTLGSTNDLGLLRQASAASYISAVAATLPPGYEEVNNMSDLHESRFAENIGISSPTPTPKGKPPPAYDDVFHTGSGQFPQSEDDNDINPPPYE